MDDGIHHVVKTTSTRSTFLMWGIFILLGLVSLHANAVVIDFDDRPVNIIDGAFYDHPLTNEYESLGLIINGGFLTGETDADGTHDNQLLASNYLYLSFTGPLPTFVSMTVSAYFDQVVFLSAIGPNGYLSSLQTSGWAGPHNDTPYTPNQYISFASSTGISGIGIGAFYNMRVGAIIDNLTLEHHASVPEPSSLILLALGCLGLLWRRRSKTIKAHN